MESLPPLADVRDLEVRLKRTLDTDPELSQAEAALDEASEIVRAESGKDWVSADDPTVVTAPRIVKVITLRVAERKLRNPDGFSSESAGDYSYQRNGVSADGALYITPWELKVLRRAAGKSGLWNQSLTRNEVSQGVFLEDSLGLELFPVADGWNALY